MGGGLSVISVSNHPVGWLVWSRPPGAWILTVVCRATFLLRPGEAILAPEQEPLETAERGYPDGSSRGLFAPCDLVPMKPRADVALVGHAFARAKQPVRSLFARLSVGEIDKRIEVFADRRFDLDGQLHDGPRFTTMPMVYERAAGGPDTANPIGMRPDARDTYGRLGVPNLQPPGIEIATPTDVIAPTCFGPIAGAWPTRRALLGPTIGASPPADWSGKRVPSDLDPSYFNAAPRDQQLQALREDERIALENLHPDHPELVTRLPGVRARGFLLGQPQGTQPMMMRADTLWIDAGRGICTLTWRGQALIEQGAKLRVIVAMQRPGQPISLEEIERVSQVAAGAAGSVRDLGHTVEASQAPATSKKKHVTLPFMVAGGHAPPREPSSGAGLPFHVPAAPPPSAPRRGSPDEETIDTPVDAQSPWIAPPPLVPSAPPPVVAPPPIAPPVVVAPPPFVPSVSPIAPPLAVAPPLLVPSVPPIAPPPIVPSVPPVAAEIAPPTPEIAATEPAAAPKPTRPVDALHLVWFDADALPRLRNDPRFSPILDALHEDPLDEALDDPDELAADIDDRREVFEILARGDAIGEEGVAPALAAAVREDGRLVQPIVLIAGELALPFDELDALKATIAAASPHAGVDPEARAVLELAKGFLATPGIPGAPSVAEGLATRIRETFEKRRLVAAGHIDGLVARALVGERCFQQRAIFGGPHVRATMRGTRPDPAAPKGSVETPMPVYLGEALAAKLPSADRVRARILAEAHPAVDQHEPHPAALRALALVIASAVR